jgi:hypothetical protein
MFKRQLQSPNIIIIIKPQHISIMHPGYGFTYLLLVVMLGVDSAALYPQQGEELTATACLTDSYISAQCTREDHTIDILQVHYVYLEVCDQPAVKYNECKQSRYVV